MFGIKLFGSEKPEHAFASADDARKELAGLPKDNASALRDCVMHAESLVTAKGFSPKLLHEVSRTLDDAAHPHYASLWKLFATTPPKFKNEAYLTAMAGHSKAMSALYDVVLRGAMRAGLEKSEIKRDDIAITVMRQMHLLLTQMKLSYMRYRVPEPSVWKQFGLALLLAEETKIISMPVQARRDEESNTIARESAKILMLAMAPVQGLEPQEVDWSDRLAAYFSSAFMVRAEVADDLPYWIDLTGSVPPGSTAKMPPASPTTRFFGAGLALAKMSDLYVNSQQGAPVPTSINSGENTIGVDDFQSLLNLLSVTWDGNASRKRASRVPLQVKLNVAHGYRDALRSIATSPRWIGFIATQSTDREREEVLDLRTYGHVTEQVKKDLFEARQKASLKRAQAEAIPLAQWETENVSSGGYGAISRGNDKWLAVNLLIASRTEGRDEFELGVVRRLHRPQLGIAHIGVEVWSKTPSPVRIKKKADKRTVEAMLSSVEWEYFEALLLSEKAPQTQTILVEPLAYKKNEECLLLVKGRETRIRMLDEIEHGAGFIRCSFELVEEDEMSVLVEALK